MGTHRWQSVLQAHSSRCPPDSYVVEDREFVLKDGQSAFNFNRYLIIKKTNTTFFFDILSSLSRLLLPSFWEFPSSISNSILHHALRDSVAGTSRHHRRRGTKRKSVEGCWCS